MRSVSSFSFGLLGFSADMKRATVPLFRYNPSTKSRLAGKQVSPASIVTSSQERNP